jgi:hypothetical protein
MLKITKDLLIKYLPKKVLNYVGFIYGLFSGKKYYSQYGEDILIYNYFLAKGKNSGIYVDIGAFHPCWISNTKILHDQGWSGHIVDLDKFKCNSFRWMRGARCTTHHGALGFIDDGKDTVTAYSFKRLLSEIDTLSFDDAEFYRNQWGADYISTEVPYLSVKKLFTKIGHVDFINIDIEGIDEQVLRAIDLKNINPDVVVFEDNRNWGGNLSIRSYLEDLGYERLFVSRGSIGYAKNGKSNFKTE